ncbi:hypothetical protein ACRWWH_21250 [Escherichia coli]
MEGAKENTREQRGHIAPKRGAAADEHTRMHRAIPSPCKANGLTGHDHADLRRRMPQLARAPASLRRPGALQQGGALYCACERQRATGATLHCCIRLAFSTP